MQSTRIFQPNLQSTDRLPPHTQKVTPLAHLEHTQNNAKNSGLPKFLFRVFSNGGKKKEERKKKSPSADGGPCSRGCAWPLIDTSGNFPAPVSVTFKR